MAKFGITRNPSDVLEEIAHRHRSIRKEAGFSQNELAKRSGDWKSAPAYDLTFSNSAHGLHSTMIAGESRNPGKQHLMKLADYFKINKAREIIQQAEDAVSGWKRHARKAGVGKESENRISKLLLHR
ncbi:MAG: serine/threonine-protein kinase HipA [Bacteroidetes bacterium]|nr:MAG: serine/threonine-protein kinase HipA [Bacteroidota bacterium]